MNQAKTDWLQQRKSRPYLAKKRGDTVKKKIEDVKRGDVIRGKSVVNVLHRRDMVTGHYYARLILGDGRETEDGYFGQEVIVEKEGEKEGLHGQG